MSGRRLSLALALGVAMALAPELLLQLALNAVHRSLSASQVLNIVLVKGRWLTAAGILAIIIPSMTRFARTPLGWRDALDLAARALIVAPVVWVAATWVVFTLRVTFADTWTTDGAVLLDSVYYGSLITENAPWVLAGVVLSAIAYHSQPVA